MIAAIAVAWPVPGFDFVLHDDPLEILSNPALHPFGPDGLAAIWTQPDFSRIYMPVTYTVLGLLCTLSRWLQDDPLAPPQPEVFHLAGMLLHAANSLLVVRLLRRTGAPGHSLPGTAAVLAGGLLFALHPVQVESYARAGNLSVTLGGFWCLASLLVFLRHNRRPGWRGCASALLLFIAGVLTRPQAVALPVAAAALAWAAGARPGLLAKRLWPWLLVSVAFTAASVRIQPPSELAPHHRVSWHWRPVIAADSLLWYAGQVLRPAQLTIDHGRSPERIASNRSAILSVAGVAAAAVAAGALARRPEWRWVSAGAAAAGALLLPVSGLVPASRRDAISVVYDRHLYLPMAGFAVIACAGLRRLPGSGWKYGIVPVAFLLALLSRQYLSVWRHSIPLFEHAVRTNPESWYANGQLGTVFLMEGRAAEAMPFLVRAAAMNPAIADTKVNLGQALLDSGDPDAAETVLREALQLAPDDPNAHNNLAVVHLRRQEFPEAEHAARQALQRQPDHHLALRNLALSLSAQERHDEALAAAGRAVETRPADAHAWRTLSEVQAAAGHPDALTSLRHACDLAPHRGDWLELLNRGGHPVGSPPGSSPGPAAPAPDPDHTPPSAPPPPEP